MGWSCTCSTVVCGLDSNAGYPLRMRSLSAKAWEDRHYVLRQIEAIGEKSYVIASTLQMPC